MNNSRQTLFRKLCQEAQTCRKCPNLAERIAVLSDLNGNISPKVLFFAEAPGRQGADRTRIPLVGDKSGENFDKFIASIGLKREEIFITNSAMCNPRKDSGANRKPTKIEIANCSPFLKRQIELLNPKIVATLGSVALEALKLIEYHQFGLKNAGEVLTWNSRILIPLFHPSPQVLASHRRFDAQIEDYKALQRALIFDV